MTTAIVSRLRGIRATQAQRRMLWRELACYTSASDLNDLEAAIARYDDAQTEDVRRILAAQRLLAARQA